MEIVDIINDKDEVVGQAVKEELYQKMLPHRIVEVLISNDKGELALQLRSRNKEGYPLYWAPTASGHMHAGEGYEAAALRELEEEAGVSAKLEFIRKDLFEGKVFRNNKPIKKMLAWFSAMHNGPFKADSSEVEKIEFFSPEKIRQMIRRGEKVHPELAFFMKKQSLL